jgi:hypothetical protein
LAGGSAGPQFVRREAAVRANDAVSGLVLIILALAIK